MFKQLQLSWLPSLLDLSRHRTRQQVASLSMPFDPADRIEIARLWLTRVSVTGHTWKASGKSASSMTALKPPRSMSCFVMCARSV